MKSLFDQNTYRFTPEAIELDTKANRLIVDLFKDYVNLGYSPREVAHIISGAVTEIELCVVLG